MIALAVSLLVLSIGPVVTVAGDAACPTAKDVSARVGQLLPVVETAGVDLARVVDAGDVVRVSLRRPDGSLIGTRELSRRSSCADLAAAAAVVLASWESDVHPEFRASLPAPRPTPAPAEVAVVSAAPKQQAVKPAFEVGAALTGSVAPSGAGAGVAAGALVVAGAAPAGGHVGARLALGAGTKRELPLGTGRVRWRHLVAALGPDARFRISSTRFAVGLHAEALLAWLSATGDGLTNDRSASSFDPGVGAGFRFLHEGHTVAPWLDLSVGGWLRRQQALASPDGAAVSLPRVEVALALGVSVVSGP
jgi:hypothetical protein